jgi:parvulin-like peptidyl-prolyl isomerase
MSDPRNVVLAKLGQRSISLLDALHCHKLGRCSDFLQAAIESAVIEETAAREGIAITADEVEKTADEFCRRNGVRSSVGRLAWLQSQGLTEADLRRAVRHEVLTAKVKDFVTAGQVECFFAERKADFDYAVVSHIVVDDAALAELVRRQADNREADFRMLAIRHNTDPATAESAGFLGPVVRSQLDPALQSAVFAANPGQVIGPIRTPLGWHVVKVWSVSNASLEGETRETVADIVFDAWLARQCAAAELVLDADR